MEKRLSSFYQSAGRMLLPVFLLLSFFARGQKLHSVKGYCGLYYASMPDLYKQKQGELDFFRFKPGETVASIGAQCCHWEAAYAAATDSVHFYLEDIDSAYFNLRQTAFAWHYYDSIRGKPMTSRYTMILGNEQSTGLPENSFDKILIINSFHEFTDKEGMLADLFTKLKRGGILYIDESVPKKQGELHGVCKIPMITPEEMKAILTANGFEFVNVLDLLFRKSFPSRKIYAFKKAGSL